MSFRQPQEIYTQAGNLRNVGFELEYAGVDLRQSVNMLASLLEVEAIQCGPFRYQLKHPQSGSYFVEVDAALLQNGSYLDYLAAIGIDTEKLNPERKLEDIIESLVSVVVPCEIVTPPLPVNDMDVIEEIVTGLRARHARGTGQSLFYAFGLHINIDVRTLDADYLLNHIRAFSLLFDWICRESKVDFSRRLAPFIKPYPQAYLKQIFSPHYTPSLDKLLNDYLELVGSRNHALDMLPILSCIDEDAVGSKAREASLVKARPAFHYRLANSSVDEPHWSVSNEWDYWLKIESLAGNPSLLRKLGIDYLDSNQGGFFKSAATWADHMDSVLEHV